MKKKKQSQENTIFNKNSSVSFINTNVIRSGSFRDANVTALVGDISNKKNTYNFEGGIRLSQIKENKHTTTGYRTNLEFRKTAGNFRFFIGHFLADQNYDPNDLGQLFRNNFNSFSWNFSYQTFKPTKRFNRYQLTLYGRHRSLFKPFAHTQTILGFRTSFFTPNRLGFGFNINYATPRKDYFEPRIEGRFVRFDPSLGGDAFVSTDYRKKFAFDVEIGHRQFFDEAFNRERKNYLLGLSPRYRFSDQFLLILSSRYSLRKDDFGYFDDNEVDAFLGLRDVTSLESSISASYNFNPYKALNLSFRNFWSTADYSKQEYYVLNNDGTLSLFDYDIEAENNTNPNRNFNTWNIDLSFRWRFSPGSEATLLYRNSIFDENDRSTENYITSLNGLFRQNIRHSFSIRIVYFLDVNNLKESF